LFGVRIFQSQYAQKGTIFKIFKNEDKLYTPPPGKTYMKQMPEDIILPTIEEEKKKNKTKKKKRKHSKTRKIELD